MSLLVTGGAGFIGSHLVEALLQSGREVVILDNFDPFYDPALKRANVASFSVGSRVTLFDGDIRDESLVEKIFSSRRFSEVVHLAARAGVRPSIQEPALYSDVNVRGTVVLLEACRRHGVQRFIFGSSSSVYGNNSKVPFSEDDPVDHPISPYAATKRAGELICATYHSLYGMDIHCLRFFTVYGPRQRPEMAISKFTRLIDERHPVPRFGDGSSRRDYTYITDIIDGVVSSIERLSGFEVLNLGGSSTTSLSELITKLAALLDMEPIVDEVGDQPGDVVATWADVSKAEHLLDYKPKISIDEGLRLAVEWYRDTVRGKELPGGTG